MRGGRPFPNRLLWLLVRTSSVLGPELAYRFGGAQQTLVDVNRYFDMYYFKILDDCVLIWLCPLRYGCWSSFSIKRIIYKRLNMFFWLNSYCGHWEGWARKRANHTSRVVVVTPIDRPKSFRNRCVIQQFGGVFCNVTLLFGIFSWYMGLKLS